MPTECVFLNTATVIFCLIYCLNTPHCNQNLSFFFLLKAQYKSLQFFKITKFGDISPYCSDQNACLHGTQSEFKHV